MIKKWLCTIFVILFSYLLQTTLFHHIKLAGVIPNLLVITTVSVGYLEGQKSGLLTGFLCGLISDMIFGSVIGLHALIYMLTGYIFGYGNIKFWRSKITVPLILIGLADLLYNFMFYVFEFLLRGKLNFISYLKTIMIPETVYTIFVAVFLYNFIRIVFKVISPSVDEEDI